MNRAVRVVSDVPQAFADLVVAERPTTLALSGSKTACCCYERLARAGFDWTRTDVLFGDERWVPVDDPDSNEGIARRVLLDHVAPRAVDSMRGSGDTLDAAAGTYDALVRATGAIGLVHLGLGPDAHTVSLFPGSPALLVRDRLVVATPGDAAHPHDRLTFTFPALDEAQLVVFTVEGQDKRDAFSRVRAGDDVPAARVAAERIVWLVDPAAAGGYDGQ